MSRNFQLLEQLDRALLGGASVHRTEEGRTIPMILKPNIGTRTCDQLDKLVKGLFLSGATTVRQVVFTGIEPDVGCTWICVHATEVLCYQTTRNVCLVDTNEHSPGMSEYFGIVDSQGFSAALTSDAPMHSFIHRVAKNAWVVAASNSRDSEPVFSPERVAARLFELRREFDFVLFDGAPVAANSSSLTVANSADGAVLVLKANHTRRQAVRLAFKELDNAHVRVLGTVLNQRDYPIPGAIYRRL
jgi:Mrp family chromosome partitioning ATPase